jgi:hypothetical protein
MLKESVGVDLDEDRTTGADLIRRRTYHPVQFPVVCLCDAVGRHKRAHPRRYVIVSLTVPHGGLSGVSVVVDDSEQGQHPRGCKIDGFPKLTSFRNPVSDMASNDTQGGSLAHLHTKGHASRDSHRSPHDSKRGNELPPTTRQIH